MLKRALENVKGDVERRERDVEKNMKIQLVKDIIAACATDR